MGGTLGGLPACLSFRIRPALVKLFHLSAGCSPEEGKTGKVLYLFSIPVWILLKTLTESGMVLDLLYTADSRRIAETSVTFPFPPGEWQLLPESSEAKCAERYLGLPHINLDKHSTISLPETGFVRGLRVHCWIMVRGLQVLPQCF